MKTGLHIKNSITIPDSELEITTSRAGGPGGQHVNKTNTKITVRWNLKNTVVLSEELKERAFKNLQAKLTSDGDLIVSSSSSRSQLQNKEAALMQLAQEIRKALQVPKKRKKTQISKSAKESRLQAKTYRSKIKKLRSSKFED